MSDVYEANLGWSWFSENDPITVVSCSQSVEIHLINPRDLRCKDPARKSSQLPDLRSFLRRLVPGWGGNIFENVSNLWSCRRVFGYSRRIIEYAPNHGLVRTNIRVYSAENLACGENPSCLGKGREKAKVNVESWIKSQTVDLDFY
jgi:hypothetical protein